MFIRKFNISHVEGMPSPYFALAKYVARTGEHLKIKTALLTGEVIYDFQKRLIEKQLGCEVFNNYGQWEQIVSACECSKHNGLHITPLVGIAEVKHGGLRGKGEIVMTTIQNYSWPLIRYSTGDNVVLSQKKCGCGCAFPRLMGIKGRSNDFILLPDGSCISYGPFTWLNMLPDIKDIYLLQNKDYSLDIFTVKEEKADAGKLKCLIEEKVSKLLNGKLKFKVILVDCIDRKSNKYRTVETKVRL